MENFIRKLERGTDNYKGMLPLKILVVVVLVILLQNVLIRIRKVMKKKIIKIKRIKETQRIFSRKVSTPRKTVHHHMRKNTVASI
jgi:hypothetical protein